jgi:hypothetical protein
MSKNCVPKQEWVHSTCDGGGVDLLHVKAKFIPPPICLHLHGEIVEGSGIHLSTAYTPASFLEKQTQVPHGYRTASLNKEKQKDHEHL